ncbi:MAG: baseplate J/gp47 family protein, partial [Candidatus Limnocylindrales bacterium]|nr:baseplate J/gp47 family protein [Candidatus Limnocylindrales bacterium]
PWAEPRPSSAAPAGRFPQTQPASRRGSRLPLVIVLAALGLVLLVGGVGAYVVLPSATIVVTPRAESLTSGDITVTADPTASGPDAAARIVPAEIRSLDVTVNDIFPATGKRVEEAAAKGTVRFENLDFLRTNTVTAGSVVSTSAGVRFRTVAAVTVPRADLVGRTVFPARISVNVTAVDPGIAGNVEPNTIVIVPKGEDPQALKVVNPDATSGGTHEEFPQVAQEDVDGAIDQLTKALSAAFQTRLADPSIAPQGATVFSETASLSEPTPSVDPATLVGQEVESFELELIATGTVVTVNPAPVTQIAEELLRATVEPGHELVAGSIDVEVGEPVVSGQSVAFSATATGEQVAILDPDDLRKLVLGKPLDDAREILASYGDVELTAWPEWVGSVPTLADRVDVRIEAGVPVETPAPTGSTS